MTPEGSSPLIRGEGRGEGARTLVLLACLMATFMTAVESTIVATAMPTVAAELGGFNLFAWVFAAYLLTQAVTIPIYGRLADLYGRKPVFFAGCALFLAGSALCGLAPNMAALIAFRTLQGIGAGAIQPVAATILGDIYTPTERGRVQGLVSSVFGVSAVLGPSLGAFLITHVGWQAVFWVNIPVGAAAVAMLAAFLREDVRHRQHRLDLAGAALLLLAMSALIVLLVQGSSLSRPLACGLAALAAASFAALLWHETRTPEPMLPLELWRNRIIVLGSLGNCAAGALMMGVAAFLPAYVQGPMGRSAIAGGLVLGAMSVSWALASLAAARIMLRTSYRFTAILAGLFLIAGCLILLGSTPARGPWWAAFGSLVTGVGMGMGSTVFIVSIQASVPWRQRGAATSSAMFMRFIGQSLGAAGAGAVLNATLTARDPSAFGAVDRLLEPASRAALDSGEAARLSALVADAIGNTYWLATGFAVVALVLALLMPPLLNPSRHAPGG